MRRRQPGLREILQPIPASEVSPQTGIGPGNRPPEYCNRSATPPATLRWPDQTGVKLPAAAAPSFPVRQPGDAYPTGPAPVVLGFGNYAPTPLSVPPCAGGAAQGEVSAALGSCQTNPPPAQGRWGETWLAGELAEATDLSVRNQISSTRHMKWQSQRPRR